MFVPFRCECWAKLLGRAKLPGRRPARLRLAPVDPLSRGQTCSNFQLCLREFMMIDRVPISRTHSPHLIWKKKLTLLSGPGTQSSRHLVMCFAHLMCNCQVFIPSSINKQTNSYFSLIFFHIQYLR